MAISQQMSVATDEDPTPHVKAGLSGKRAGWERLTCVPACKFWRRAWTMRRGPMALISKCILRPSAVRSPNLS